MAEEDESRFDAAKAELFEAVGHPNRIKIIQALDQGGMGFAELKKKVGMESSGHLAFHLGKLDHLVAVNADGQYALTGEGREALRMIQTVREHGPRRRLWGSPLTRRSLVALLLVLVVAFATVAAVQQLEIASLSSKPPGTVNLNGRAFWYTAIPLQDLPVDRNTSVLVDGVSFTLIPSNFLNRTYLFTVSLLGGTNASGSPVTFSLVTYPDVLVRFADGKTETMYNDHVTSYQNIINFSFAPPNFPWFSNHLSPQVAISENDTAVTLYVSTGR